MKLVKSREELDKLLVTAGAFGNILKTTSGMHNFNHKMYNYCNKPKPVEWCWDELWLKEVDTTTPLKVGDKVVPFQKTTHSSLEKSYVCKEAMAKGQKFLYYTGTDKNDLLFVATLSDTGDYFNREDVYLYEE